MAGIAKIFRKIRVRRAEFPPADQAAAHEPFSCCPDAKITRQRKTAEGFPGICPGVTSRKALRLRSRASELE